MIFAVQAISILFAIFCARHDGPAVQQFEDFGKVGRRFSIFHSGNFQLKVCFVVLACLVGYPVIIDMARYGLLAFLWVYLVFDPALNIFRSTPDRPFPWYYLGSNDGDGRRWMQVLGKNAGKWKAVILVAAILLINLYKNLFHAFT